jgi:hypothetical protein
MVEFLGSHLEFLLVLRNNFVVSVCFSGRIETYSPSQA